MSTLKFQPEADRFYDEGWWRAGDLWSEFAARAAEAPDKIALILEDRDVSYAELRAAAVALSARAAALGAEPGDAVILIGRHSIGAVVALLGCLHRGLVVAPLPPMAPDITPSASTIGIPPGKVISPSLECSIP